MVHVEHSGISLYRVLVGRLHRKRLLGRARHGDEMIK
jgi:hypothetical protein